MNSDDRLTRRQRNQARRGPFNQHASDADLEHTDDDIAQAIQDYARRRYAEQIASRFDTRNGNDGGNHV